MVGKVKEKKPMSLEIWNRRYTGSKYKLVDWISELIDKHCEGQSFCDIFAGTGVVAATELAKFERIIVNDFLYSNNAIYTAFFANLPYNMEKLTDLIQNWLSIPSAEIPDNFITNNYGDKYFSFNDAKIIGFLRHMTGAAQQTEHEMTSISDHLKSATGTTDEITIAVFGAPILQERALDYMEYMNERKLRSEKSLGIVAMKISDMIPKFKSAETIQALATA